MKTFFILFLWMGAGNAQTTSLDHFDSKEECLAARQALVDQFKDNWFKIHEEEIWCIEVHK